MCSLHQLLLLCAVLCWHQTPALDTSNIPTAVNVRWSSINFKTILEWEPKPTDYVYTVEVSTETSDWRRKCVYITETECDITDEMMNVNETYQARVVSEVPGSDDLTEFPHTNSPPFIPYKETLIGSPTIESYNFNEQRTKLTFMVKDPLTPYRSNGGFLSIRDIFKSDLKYTLFYWKASSTGKKQAMSTSNTITIDVEKGESYCYSVRATVESRRLLRDSDESAVECTEGGNGAAHISTSSESLYLCISILLLYLLQ
ncbi:tissue factor isoform 2-T2 [Discoglossus pictus]